MRANHEGTDGDLARTVLAQPYFLDIDGPTSSDYPSGDEKSRVLRREDGFFGTMADCLFGIGTDDKGEYVSYYDFWDLDLPALGTRLPAEVVAGWPIEFYDRIHFDRAKIEKVIDLEDEIVTRWMIRCGRPPSDERLIRQELLRVGFADYYDPRLPNYNIEDELEQIRMSWPTAEQDDGTRALLAKLCELDARRAAQFSAPVPAAVKQALIAHAGNGMDFPIDPTMLPGPISANEYGSAVMSKTVGVLNQPTCAALDFGGQRFFILKLQPNEAYLHTLHPEQSQTTAQPGYTYQFWSADDRYLFSQDFPLTGAP